MNNYLKLLLAAAFLGIVAVAAIVMSLGLSSGGGDATTPSVIVDSNTSACGPLSPGLVSQSVTRVASRVTVQRVLIT